MSTASAIEAVLFDADGVIQSTPQGWLASLEALAPEGEARRFTTAVFTAEAPCLVGLDDFSTTLAEVLARFGCRATLDEALSLWRQLTPHPEVLALAAALRARGLFVGLATNQQSVRARYMRDVMGYAARFDALYFSCELGHAKPDPHFFSTIVQRIARPPSTLVFIDDREANVVAARQVGLRAARFDARDGVEALVNALREQGVSSLTEHHAPDPDSASG